MLPIVIFEADVWIIWAGRDFAPVDFSNLKAFVAGDSIKRSTSFMLCYLFCSTSPPPGW